MNIFGTSGSAGSVLVYPKGSGGPNSYTNPEQFYYAFGGYDGSGNLFFDGRKAAGAFILSELKKGAASATTIKLKGGKVYFPGMVQPIASSTADLIVGDQNCENAMAACVYSLSISGGTGTVKEQTKLDNGEGGPVCDLVQAVVENGKVLGSDNDYCDYGSSATYVWPYPAGGSPLLTNAGTVSQPFGAAVSVLGSR
jgi:hypothetical protein